MNSIIVTNKKGTTFERKPKVKTYDTCIWARCESEKTNKFDAIAKEKGVKSSTLLREILYKYIEDYENGIDR